MDDQEKVKLMSELSDLIHKTSPKAHAVCKYGGTIYTLKPDEKEGQFCGVFPYKNHVQLAFSQGTELDDPQSLLSGEGKNRRHINFKDIQDIDKPALKRFLKQAAMISLS